MGVKYLDWTRSPPLLLNASHKTRGVASLPDIRHFNDVKTVWAGVNLLTSFFLHYIPDGLSYSELHLVGQERQ